ncbi:MAG: phosphodiester glycosidase family protein [Chloroflexi bacterium]|nr:phosphodiester glycosidase family protein [Chloroflexota bacterium]
MPIRWRWLLIFAAATVVGIYVAAMLGRPPALPAKYELYKGVTYRRVVRYLPHTMLAHVIVVDRREAGVKFLVTPPDQVEGGAVKARTVTEFAKEFNVQIAINGDGFFPWWSRSLVDYYPHSGDPVTPLGYSASFGNVYAEPAEDADPKPVLYISRRNELTFNLAPGKIHHAISGDAMLIQGGEIEAGLDDSILHPRTAVGVSRNGRYVILVVVDGRQPFYSAGATYQELAELLKDFDAHAAMALDGGGSSTLAVNLDGEVTILNSPIDNYIPGRERPVANHFGVFVDQ